MSSKPTRTSAPTAPPSTVHFSRIPFGSLNPRRRIGAILEEPLVAAGRGDRAERRRRARDMLARVGLRPEHADRYPAHVLGRPKTAHRDRPGADAGAKDRRRGRTGIRARRLGPGAGAEFAHGSAARDGARLSLHLARSRRRASPRARCPGALSRASLSSRGRRRRSSRGRCIPIRARFSPARRTSTRRGANAWS